MRATFITDRKKDLFKLSNGKYIAPQQLESLLKQSEFVNQVVVIGSSRKFPAALIVPDWEDLKSELRAAGENVGGSHADISRMPAAIKLVQKDVTASPHTWPITNASGAWRYWRKNSRLKGVR
jgi:long-chain acyl-CoA synthetase